MGLRCEGTNMAHRYEYLWLTLHTSWPLVFCIDTHVCTVSKVISINKEKEMSAKQRIYKFS